MDIAFVDITDFIGFGQVDISTDQESIHMVNSVWFMESSDVDGTLISELKQGKDGASIKLPDRMKALDWIANHLGWQGAQYQLEGKSDEYENLVDSTGYGSVEGLNGVNCRHRMYVFFPGISIPINNSVDDEENMKYYNATQNQRKLERDIRKLRKKRKCLNEIGANDDVRKLDVKIKKKSFEIDRLCEKYGLKREYARERVI